ncbi:MAG: radical SAM family heme chaperone HemW [Selenomonadaceae bacterium]|nr:radical SAM family heme chaperone HemW [Selenomonadaceae bacterium]MBR7025146.1 radical SAM family heme chaperone HemW [Selenomonadaceae bacterium]
MIYIHVPFCERKCNYCAFNSKRGDEAEKISYVEALIEEINFRGDNSKVETIYFGGGTPTTLTLNQLEKILCAVNKNFRVDAQAEITIEANPGTVLSIRNVELGIGNYYGAKSIPHSSFLIPNCFYLCGLKVLGFNRLSLGVQSFDDALLKILGRIHDSRTAIETIALAKNFFVNVSLDLMYALPCQTLNHLRRDLDRVKNLDVRHVSIYGLEIEEGTKFFELARAGKLNLPDENTCADMYDLITETLPAFGFNRYEISNFAVKNFESRHNIGYWTGKKYFGFGAGAHSFDGKQRTSNVRDVATYIKKNFSIVEEVVTPQAAMEEFCFLGLRMTEGISARTFEKNFGKNIFDVFGGVIDKNRRLGLLEVDGDKIFLTARGMSLGNEVFADFLL